MRGLARYAPASRRSARVSAESGRMLVRCRGDTTRKGRLDEYGKNGANSLQDGAGALLGAAAFATNTAPAASDRPNIIFIMADDLGYADLGCYGQQKIKTPNIDRLAAEGTRFTQCYAGAGICAPSRSVLMTGLHGGHTTVRDNRGECPEPRGEAGRIPLRPGVTVAEVHATRDTPRHHRQVGAGRQVHGRTNDRGLMNGSVLNQSRDELFHGPTLANKTLGTSSESRR